jgi:hypothetical protein
MRNANIISGKLTNRLQRVPNCATRLVTRTHKREHITPGLDTSTNYMAPEYLCELMSFGSHPEYSGPSVRYYSRCLGSSHMLIVRLAL